MSGVDLSGLTASFGGERVIGPLSLSVREGERVGLVGRSGAGKSTLIRLVYEQVERLAALVPQAELEGEMGDSHMGLHARLMSQALRKLTGSINRSHTCVVFLNQLRMKIGVVFGSPETTPGGKALKFYASVRIDIRRREQLKDSTGQVIGNHVKTKIVKNKVAPPFAEAEFDIMYNQGINWEGSVIDAGLRFGVLDKKGA